MSEQVRSIAAIQREAQAAARQYTNVNDACPYPFQTDAGQVFKAAFQQARAQIAPGQTARAPA